MTKGGSVDKTMEKVFAAIWKAHNKVVKPVARIRMKRRER